MNLSPAQRSFFAKNGYLVIKDLLTAEEKTNIVDWTNQVRSWPEDGDIGYLPYQELDSKGRWILCITEVHQTLPFEMMSLLIAQFRTLSTTMTASTAC